MTFKKSLSLLLMLGVMSGCSKDNNTDAPMPESSPPVSVQEDEIVEEVELDSNNEEPNAAENSEVVADIKPDYNNADVTDSALGEEIDEEQVRYDSVTGEPLYPEVDGPEFKLSQSEIDELNENAAN